MLMDKIDKMNEAFKNEIATYKKETGHQKNQVSDKVTQIKKLEDKIDQLSHCANLEFPIVISKNQTAPSSAINMPKQQERSRENSTNAPKFINMRKQHKSPFLEEIEMDLDDIMNKNPFGEVDNDEIQLSSFNNNVKKQAKKQDKKQGLRTQKSPLSQRISQNPQVQQMFSISDSFKQQISSVLISDDIIKNMKIAKNESLKKLDNQHQINSRFNDKVDQFQKEKAQMGEKLADLTKDNENLKLKFSQLLD